MSARFQAHNDLKFGIVKAARRLEPSIDFVSTQEAGLDGVGDPELLDRRTMIDHFRAHLAAGKSSPALLIVPQDASIGDVMEALVYIWVLSDPSELRDQAYYVPSLFHPVKQFPLPTKWHGERHLPIAKNPGLAR